MTATVADKDFGRYLQIQRRTKGMALDAISHQTKIPMDILRQIENENLARLPAPVYVKGFLRAFAHAVDADPQEALNRFENRSVRSRHRSPVPGSSPMAAGGWKRLFLALALFMLNMGLTIYGFEWMHNQPKAPNATSNDITAKVVAHSGTAEASQESRPHKATPSAMTSPLPLPEVGRTTTTESLQTQSSDLKLYMKAVEATWLKVTTDDRPPKEFFLQTDHHLTMVAKSKFDLVIGNASGIRLLLNDQPVPVVGKRGQVVDLHLP